MARTEKVALNLYGTYRDILRDGSGGVIRDSGWRKNVIVTDARRLLAGFLLGTADTLGIQGLQLGQGLDIWDDAAGPPPPTETDTALIDPNPHLIPVGEMEIDFLEVGSDTPSVLATNRIQIRATIGPGVPPWPDGTHPASTLREFGLVARLNGTNVLVNNVRHLAITKDPTSTLERTIWLVF
jgi:hypothetical protein